MIVGQNAFVAEAPPVPVTKIDPELEREQRQRLQSWRKGRDANAHKAAIGRLSVAADGDDNLMPLLIDAVKAGATVGEMSDSLRAVWGEHSEIITI